MLHKKLLILFFIILILSCCVFQSYYSFFYKPASDMLETFDNINPTSLGNYEIPAKPSLSLDTGEKNVKECTNEILDVYRKMATMA